MELPKAAELPKMAKVRQNFPTAYIEDVPAEIKKGMAQVNLAARIKPGSRVALTAGSRGIARIPEILRAVAQELKAVGAKPFIVPAMGSHGGATPEGQTEVLTGYGITEASTGCPILSSMETVELGTTATGATVYMDRNASLADATIVVARVKAHTAFKGEIESGLCKMMAIGLGKQRGAESIHDHDLKESIPQVAEIMLERANIALGVAVVENSFDQPYRITVVPPERFLDTDRELLKLSNSLLPRVPFDPLDLLIVEWMGKNISGSGMDYNIVGMWRRIGGEKRPLFKRIVVLNLTPESHGNALGVGIADFTTKRLVNQIDHHKMYMNALTGNVIEAVKIPIIMENDREAVLAALRSAQPEDSPRVVRIHSTLHLEELYASEALLEEVKANPNLRLLGEPEPVRFDAAGNLV